MQLGNENRGEIKTGNRQTGKEGKLEAIRGKGKKGCGKGGGLKKVSILEEKGDIIIKQSVFQLDGAKPGF